MTYKIFKSIFAIRTTSDTTKTVQNFVHTEILDNINMLNIGIVKGNENDSLTRLRHFII